MMTHYYLDTSVLLIYTLASGKEVDRYPFVSKLFNLIESEKIKATTSFYALHELYIFALENAPDFDTGSQYGKEAMNIILSTKVQLTPLLSRMERMINARLFNKLSDSQTYLMRFQPNFGGVTSLLHMMSILHRFQTF